MTVPGDPATVDVAGAPAIDGLRFRRFSGESDHMHLLNLQNTCLEADGAEHLQTLAGVANAYRPSATFDPRENVMFAEIGADPAPIAFSRIRADQPLADGTRIYGLAGYVLPPWRRRGIGGAMFDHSENRLRRLAAAQPADGPRFFGSYAFDGQHGNRALLESRGYAAVPELSLQDMVRPTLDGALPAPLPAGLEVRPVGPEHKRPIWELYEDAGRDDLATAPGTEDDYQQWASWPFWDESIWQIAWDGDEPVGMVLNYVNAEENARYSRRRGYTEYINVARSWRRRGVARALIVRSLGVLQERGMTEAALDVYVHNPTGARQVYESLGYRAIRTMFTYRKSLAAPGTDDHSTAGERPNSPRR